MVERRDCNSRRSVVQVHRNPLIDLDIYPEMTYVVCMPKIKTYGPANNIDVPEDELLLAEVIAFAEHRGLKWQADWYWSDANGEHIHDSTAPGIACACAFGAASMAGITELEQHSVPHEWRNVVAANDEPLGRTPWISTLEVEGQGYDFGAAYRAYWNPEENES